jgi:glycosyltransferase involved in cell wall biosynthesis
LSKKKILFLTHHWKDNTHHSKYSGYQALVNYALDAYDCTVVTWGRENKVSNENGINVHYVRPLLRRDFFFSKRLAISLYAKKIENRFDVVHALYSDCGFYQSHPNFYSTIHVSPFVVKNVKWVYLLFLFLKYIIIERRVIKNSKNVFVVSENLKLVRSKNKSKFIFVPHGVNTTYWSPKNVNNESHYSTYPENFVLCVGNHGIDKKVLYRTIKSNPNVIFITVGLKEFDFEFNNLKTLHNVSDNELKSLYMHCALFIRPMDFATANNSILEALSMGCRVLISTPDGSCDYIRTGISDEAFMLVRSSDFLEAFRPFLISSPQCMVKDRVRKYAVENFDWHEVWRQTASIFEKNFK